MYTKCTRGWLQLNQGVTHGDLILKATSQEIINLEALTCSSHHSWSMALGGLTISTWRNQ